MKEKEKGILYCCETCQVFWTCDTKWYRGERQEEDVCCPRCNFYTTCLAKLGKKDRQAMEKLNEQWGK